MVEKLGAGVENLQVGQRVIGGAQQTWADYYLVDARYARPVPNGIDDETACQLIAMPLSAKMVLADLGLQSGDWLVQNSANGAVGRLLSRFGAEKGVGVLSLVRRDAAVAELAAAGITNVVSTEQPCWEARAQILSVMDRSAPGSTPWAGTAPRNWLAWWLTAARSSSSAP